MSYHANDHQHTLTADFSRGLYRMHKHECTSAGSVTHLPSAYPHACAAAAAHAGKAPSAHHAATARTAHGLRSPLSARHAAAVRTAHHMRGATLFTAVSPMDTRSGSPHSRHLGNKPATALTMFCRNKCPRTITRILNFFFLMMIFRQSSKARFRLKFTWAYSF